MLDFLLKRDVEWPMSSFALLVSHIRNSAALEAVEAIETRKYENLKVKTLNLAYFIG